MFSISNLRHHHQKRIPISKISKTNDFSRTSTIDDACYLSTSAFAPAAAADNDNDDPIPRACHCNAAEHIQRSGNHATQRYSLWNRNETHRAGRWQRQWQLTPSTGQRQYKASTLSSSLPCRRAGIFQLPKPKWMTTAAENNATNDNNGDLQEVRQFFHDSFPDRVIVITANIFDYSCTCLARNKENTSNVGIVQRR